MVAASRPNILLSCSREPTSRLVWQTFSKVEDKWKSYCKFFVRKSDL